MDFRLYFISIEMPEQGRSHTDTAAAAAKGGATVIQFRDKVMDDRQFEETALEIKKIAGKYGIPLIINDRVEIGVRIRADGVHVGQGDLNVKAAREAIGSEMTLGCSVSSAKEAKAAEEEGADYIGAGPVFRTDSKGDAAPPIGLEELKRICAAVKIPVVAIGGIDGHNIAGIIGSGAAGAAVISAIAGASDMEGAAAGLIGKWENK